MKTLGIILLVLIGGFTGLCSGGFTLVTLFTPGDFGIILPFVIPGFLITWGCYAGIRALTRPSSPARPIPSLSDKPPEE